jgi:GAF domain-containing protein
VELEPAGFSRLARELCSYGDRAATAEVIAERGVQTLPCGYSAVVRCASGGRVTFEAVTASSLLSIVERVANQTGEGPSLDAFRDKTTVLMDDVFEETRWPLYRAEIRAHTAIRSALALYLDFVGEALGVLAFYDDRPGWFTDERIHVAEVFADHATIALAKAADHDQARQTRAALASNRVIGNAVGILMATYRVDQQQGFDLLRQVSNHTNRRLVSIAEEVTLTGALPDQVPVRRLLHDPRPADQEPEERLLRSEP